MGSRMANITAKPNIILRFMRPPGFLDSQREYITIELFSSIKRHNPCQAETRVIGGKYGFEKPENPAGSERRSSRLDPVQRDRKRPAAACHYPGRHPVFQREYQSDRSAAYGEYQPASNGSSGRGD